ncbi:hypothetical protein I3843_09G128100 [Carya illinoinensis]|uniref:Uncharacterized protein n=1 Tax=Carya illinoinensis TaxID=32201 RepID=A0A8T1PKF1_CARIL|nr:hypothetical protein CIPAW_09G132600 [Carya illinoinensis]KAG6696101.1 hypothetical protein I3842_09G130400 [Carya illinoinensis]KAG7963635.1 hypothetical protein I3843_09G128100 [Carya illinoinensis]
MAKTAATSRFLLFFFLLFLTTAPKPSHSLVYSQYRTFVSLAQSLTTRVANLRASRGDFTGSRRAKDIAEQLERGLGLGLWGFTWSVGWDYVKNYAWREVSYDDLYGAITDANELLRRLGELTRTDSGADSAEWVGRNYQNVLGISSSLLKRLLNVFRQSGTLRKVVETVETEVVDGGFLKDCLEVGTNDLKGLLQIVKDLASQFYSSSSGNDGRDL